MELTPEQALAEMDNIASQMQMTRPQHAHLVNCKQILDRALTELAELKKPKEA